MVHPIILLKRISRHRLGELGRSRCQPIVHGMILATPILGVILDPEDLGVTNKTSKWEITIRYGILYILNEAKSTLALMATRGHLHHRSCLTAYHALFLGIVGFFDIVSGHGMDQAIDLIVQPVNLFLSSLLASTFRIVRL